MDLLKKAASKSIIYLFMRIPCSHTLEGPYFDSPVQLLTKRYFLSTKTSVYLLCTLDSISYLYFLFLF